MARRRKKGLKKEMRYQVKGILLLALAAFCYVGLTQTGQAGGIGYYINWFLRILAGNAAVAIPFFIAIFAIRLIIPRTKSIAVNRLAGLLLLIFSVMIWIHLGLLISAAQTPAGSDLFRESFLLGMEQKGGGVIGGIFSAALFYLFGATGSRILIIALIFISIVLFLNISLNRAYKLLSDLAAKLVRMMRALLKGTGRLSSRLVTAVYNLFSDDEKSEDDAANDKDYRTGNMHDAEESRAEGENRLRVGTDEAAAIDQFTAVSRDYSSTSDVIISNPKESDSGSAAEGDKEEQGRLQVDSAKEYLIPPIDLLSLPQPDRGQGQVKSSKERAKLLENTLLSFGVRAKVVHVQSGPTVTRFEVQPEAGVKVSKIISLSDDLALNLAAPLVRIEAPIPGKAALGIEVPNKVISLVKLREVMEEGAYQCSASELTIALGKDITGDPVVADLTKMPHLLIAGATGAGKSVCLNTLITSILYKGGPEKVRFLMIDPKVVELSVYNGIPHLLMPVLTDPRKASLALRNMVREMGRRYDLFARLEVRDIATYNDLAAKDEELEKLPFIVVIIDELADLMLVAPGEVEDSIARLAQMSRAAGIHLVVATQRPSVDVLTGIIKANITSRIAFTVSSQFDSRTILDMSGAEKLLGRGDMLFYPVGAVKPFRVQGAYVSEVEVKKITDHIKAQGRVEYENGSAFLEVPEEIEEEETDALFAEAVDLVVRTGQASISLLQRRFRIGYTRAARLIDDLERRGVVGQFEGSKPREVLVTQEQAAQICEEFNKKDN